MQTFYDYKRFAVLYVDDEEKSLKYFTQAFGEQFQVLTATNAQDGYRLLEEHQDKVGILMTDQRMPGEKGVQLLERARQLRPRIIRILVTAYSDLDAAIAAVNTGAIYKYITKPWEPPELEVTLKRGLEFFIVTRERDQLLREKMSVLHNLIITDRVVSLGILAAGLSHHIRNSLVAVRTFLDLAPTKLQAEKTELEDLRNPYFWKDFYVHVQHQVKRIIEMLNDLGVASESPPPLFQDQVRLHSLLSGILEAMATDLKTKSIEVANEIPESLPVLTVDRTKFRRLFELLLKDELVNLQAGGHLELKARVLPGAEGAEPKVQVEISDDGPGLPETALRSVFDPFFVRNADPQEFGINLMACYFIVFHHAGTIEVKTKEGKGAKFILTFPTTVQARRELQVEEDFLARVLMNETLWERLLAGP